MKQFLLGLTTGLACGALAHFAIKENQDKIIAAFQSFPSGPLHPGPDASIDELMVYRAEIEDMIRQRQAQADLNEAAQPDKEFNLGEVKSKASFTESKDVEETATNQEIQQASTDSAVNTPDEEPAPAEHSDSFVAENSESLQSLHKAVPAESIQVAQETESTDSTEDLNGEQTEQIFGGQ